MLEKIVNSEDSDEDKGDDIYEKLNQLRKNNFVSGDID